MLRTQIDAVKDVVTGFYASVHSDDLLRALERIARILGVPESEWHAFARSEA
jgi:hypothetical protein